MILWNLGKDHGVRHTMTLMYHGSSQVKIVGGGGGGGQGKQLL